MRPSGALGSQPGGQKKGGLLAWAGPLEAPQPSGRAARHHTLSATKPERWRVQEEAAALITPCATQWRLWALESIATSVQEFISRCTRWLRRGCRRLWSAMATPGPLSSCSSGERRVGSTWGRGPRRRECAPSASRHPASINDRRPPTPLPPPCAAPSPPTASSWPLPARTASPCCATARRATGSALSRATRALSGPASSMTPR